MDVLIHQSEYWRPTSTGRLVGRVVSGSRQHVYRREAPPPRGAVVRPGAELWVLHPRGEPVPAGPPPPGLQVLLLDGSWREAARMAETTGAWGRRVGLPAAGPSRYGLRTSPHPGTYATAEALVLLLAALGLDDPARELRLQFDLHVYAALRTRGARVQAEAFLAGSSLPEAFPAVLAELHRRRRREERGT